MVRLGINRGGYRVNPGLYALGEPSNQSLVFVTANYKLSFNALRSSLKGLSAWILVLDTKGINVWCAAGKGTFGTVELLHQIESTNLKERVTHRSLILPQLGATGVAAHEVKKMSGFQVIYGPVKAKDIPAFINSNNHASESMREIQFGLWDRVVLTPIEFIHALFPMVIIAAALTLIAGLQNVKSIVALLFLAVLSGTVLTPMILPWIPGRPFSLKGAIVGVVVTCIALICLHFYKPIFVLSWLLLATAIASFLAMNFTGSSTYTSLSGVKKEMKIAVPVQIVAFSFGIILFIVNRFI